ncbi:peptidylprolyl isomerase [Planctomycetota bacterium]
MNRTVLLAIFITASVCIAGDPPAPEKTDKKDVEFTINGEAFTKSSMMKGLGQCPAYNPAVCPTETSAGWIARRTRLIRCIPLRQFLDAEGVKVPKEAIDAVIEKMKKDPNPFGKQPPKPVTAVMVRDCITWDDLRLMIRVDIGMKKWVERQWTEKWPTAEKWKEHCRNEAAAFEEHYGRFSRLSFSISNWPPGAKDEADALKILKTRADEAKKRLDAKEDFDKVAKDPSVKAQTVPAQILPFRALGSDHADTLKQLGVGQTSDPIATRFSWEIVRREKLPPEDLSEVLKIRFLVQTQADAEKKVAAEAKIEKINWMGEDELYQLGPGL